MDSKKITLFYIDNLDLIKYENQWKGFECNQKEYCQILCEDIKGFLIKKESNYHCVYVYVVSQICL